MRASVEVDARVVRGEIDPAIYGHFIENMARCIYGGLLRNERPGDPRGPWYVNEEVVRLISQLEPPVVRWPGGLYADTYHWRDGVGPLRARPLNLNRYWSRLGPATRVLDPHAFGSDEFMAFTDRVGAKPYVNVNLGTGSPEEAAAWVEYMNGPPGTVGGGLRASYGREKPYRVKTWGIGNEMYGGWAPGHLGPREYAAKYLEFRRAMAGVDDGLRCVAVGAPAFLDENWNREVLEAAGGEIDLLSIHIYLPSIETAPLVAVQRRLSGADGMFKAVVASPLQCEGILRSAAGDVKSVMGEKSAVKVALDEWNLWWKPSQVINARWTLRDALFACGMFHVFHRSSSFLKMANVSMLVNMLGLLRVSGSRVYRTALYYPFLMYGRLSGTRSLKSAVSCGSFDSPRLGRIPPAREVPLLDCSATMSSEGGSLTIFVINRHMKEEIEADIVLEGFEPAAEVRVHCLNAPDALAENTYDDDEVVSVGEVSMDSGDVLPRYRFPAHSATAIVLERKDRA
jgi:alpha-L-arabinofuranosidase